MPSIMEVFSRHFEEARSFYETLVKDEEFTRALTKLAVLLQDTLRGGKTLLVAGNGGSAAEAQHLAAEIVGRYKKERPGLSAIALTTDTSILTAIGNDYSFDAIFARQVEALGRSGDLLLLLSTSGNSKNLVSAAQQAKKKGLRTCALLGKGGGLLANEVDVAAVVPSVDTARIQESHLLLVHALSELVDELAA